MMLFGRDWLSSWIEHGNKMSLERNFNSEAVQV